jgi:magnesium chelatase family protein
VRNYEARVSGPIRDRFDLTVKVDTVDVEALMRRDDPNAKTSAEVREKVARAREIQRDRHRRREVSAALNARLGAKDLSRVVRLDAFMRRSIGHAVERGLTARGFDKVLRVARTIADLEGRDRVLHEDLALALQFRGHGEMPPAPDSTADASASGGASAAAAT